MLRWCFNHLRVLSPVQSTYTPPHTSHGCSLNINSDEKGKRLFVLKLLNAFKCQDGFFSICSGEMLLKAKGVLVILCVSVSLRSHLCVFQGKPGGLGSTGEKGPPGEPVSMMSSDAFKPKLCLWSFDCGGHWSHCHIMLTSASKTFRSVFLRTAH